MKAIRTQCFAFLFLMGIALAPAQAQLFSPTYDLNKSPTSASDAPNVLAFGPEASASFGNVVKAADLNGDGADDFIVGSSQADVGAPLRTNAGAVYVWFGNPALAGTKDSAGISGAAPDLTIHGASSGDSLSLGLLRGSLAMGDLNGDNVTDLVLGAFNANGPAEGRSLAGEVYVIFGRQDPATFPATLDLSLQGTSGADVTIYGASVDDQIPGNNASLAVGDVNGDDVDDLLIGTPEADGPADGRPSGGEAYVVFGRTNFPTTLDLAVQGSNGANVTIYGAFNVDFLTRNGTIKAGDLNADGVDDIVLGADSADGPAETRLNSGEAYIVFGRQSSTNFPATLDMAVQGSSGADVTIYAANTNDALTSGGAMAVGEVNGDEVADLLLGAPMADHTFRNNCGKAYMVFGRTNFPATLDLGVPGSTGADVTLIGASGGAPASLEDRLTTEGALTVGDVNGDGIGDVLLGSKDADGPGDTRAGAGEAYIVIGRTNFLASLDMALTNALTGANVTLYGASAGDALTAYGSLAAGDFNGDGKADLVLGAFAADGPSEARSTAGEAYIVLGRSVTSFPTVVQMTNADVTIYGASTNDGLTTGQALAIGDVTGDDVYDLLLGATGGDGPLDGRSQAGEAYALFGIGPEIVVEQPAGTNIVDGGTRSFGTLVIGSQTNVAFTIKNIGYKNLTGLGLTTNGVDATLFNVIAMPVAPVIGPTGSTTFTMQFTPTSSGAKTAQVHMANNDFDENPFDITLVGQALSPGDDTDGDGLNDAAEFLMSSLGFNWQVSQTGLVDTLYDQANVAGLFTTGQVQALHTDMLLISRDPSTGQFKLTMGVEKATNLTNFLLFPMSATQTVINGQGELEFQFTVPDNAAFFRLEGH